MTVNDILLDTNAYAPGSAALEAAEHQLVVDRYE